MLLIECSQIKKYYAERLILDIKEFKIYSEDKIGIVGVNGVGKTTLMDLLSKRLLPDEGLIKLHGLYSYISQIGEPEQLSIDDKIASKFKVRNTWDMNMSGGEKTKFKVAEGLAKNNMILFADEPTSNVDIEGIELIEHQLGAYNGALVLISHDRNFLDKLCNKILEIEHGKIKIYNGNYSDYYEQKKQEIERQNFEYDQYVKENKRLIGMAEQTRKQAGKIKRTPKRMGNSEARLHKMGGQNAKANLDRSIKNIQKRIEHLEVKNRPQSQEIIKLDILDTGKLHSKIVIEGKKINKTFGNRIILKDANFSISNGAKVALIGSNGCGKTTLVNMIMIGATGIKVAQGARIGYFSQNMNILDQTRSIIENVMETSIYNQTFVRILLGRLLFKQEDIDKKIHLLSGGERVKVAFAKLLLQDINLLILDEPNNYLDISSLQVVEEALQHYDKTLLLISHDRKLIDSVADHLMIIENHKIKMFTGSYREYLSTKKPKSHTAKELKQEILILENSLAQIIGKLSMPFPNDDIEALDTQYHETLTKLNKLRHG